jgi:hypothetical protein
MEIVRLNSKKKRIMYFIYIKNLSKIYEKTASKEAALRLFCPNEKKPKRGSG